MYNVAILFVLYALPSPLECEQKAIEYRRAIAAMHYASVETCHELATEVRSEKRFGSRQEVWADVDRYRCDETSLDGLPTRVQAVLSVVGADGKPRVKSISRLITCRGCVPGGALLHYQAGVTPVHLLSPTPRQLVSFNRDLFEPRALGHTISSSSGESSTLLQGLLADPKVKYLTAQPVLLRGEDAVLVEGEFIVGTSVHRCWLVPAKGYSVIRFEWSERPAAAGGPRKMYVEIDNELRQDTPSGVWFPKRSVARRYTTDVEVAEFNRPPDPSAFTLAGLKLGVGVPVHDNAVGKSKFWDGTKLVEASQVPLAPEYKDLARPRKSRAALAATRPVDPTRTPRWVYPLAAGLAVVGLGLLFLARRSRR